MAKQRRKRRPEVDRLKARLKAPPPVQEAAPPEVLVPPQTGDWVGEKVRALRKVAADPRRELLEPAEKILVTQARRLLKVNELYGISLSGLVRRGAQLLLTVPRQVQDSKGRKARTPER